MKTGDQQLLEEAYQQVLQQNTLLTEGAIMDAIKSVGSKTLNKIKSFLIDPNNHKLLMSATKIAAPLLFAIATGDIASAADAMQNVFTPSDFSHVMDQAKIVFDSGNEEAIKKFLDSVQEWYVNGLSDSIGQDNSRQAMETIKDQYLALMNQQLKSTVEHLPKIN